MPRIDPPRLTTVPLLALPSGRYEAVELPTGPEHWYRFAIGYKEAADHLAGVMASDPARHQVVAAPMLFAYRHYIELHLKSLLLNAGELLDDPQVVPPKHYLLTLWHRVAALLRRVSPESDGPWFVRADGIIRELDSVDATSYAFRYPVDTIGSASLPVAFAIDPANVRPVMDELHVLLNGASIQIDVYMGYKNDAL